MKMDELAGSKQDEFYTPAYAVEPIIKYLKKKKFKTIWCPFDTKDSQFVKILRKEKFKVVYTHISKGKDFFKIVDKGKVPKCDAIVSNPPYSKKTEVLTYLFDLDIPFAMLLGIAGLFDSLERAELFSKNKFEILFLNPRVAYFSGKENKTLTQPPFQSVYICHDILPKKLLFAKVKRTDTRENPYTKRTKDFYLVNPNTGEDLWWHYTTTDGLSDFNMRDLVLEKSLSPYSSNETYFAGSPELFTKGGSFEDRYKGIFELKIKIGKDCTIFDARDLFSEVPKWVMNDIQKVFEICDFENDWFEDFFYEIGKTKEQYTIKPETYKYLKFGDLGRTLNTWRQNSVSLILSNKTASKSYEWERHDKGDLEIEFLIRLWLLQFSVVQLVLTYPEEFPIYDDSLINGCIGWIEREGDFEYYFNPLEEPINLALFHGSENSIIPYLDESCLPKTSIEILDFERV